MRKIVLALALALALAGNSASAQSDGFFNNWKNIEDRSDNGFEFPVAPGHGTTDDNSGVPLGSGLLMLTALGVGYGVKRRVMRD